MPRRPRSDLAGFPLHVIQRGNNRSECFFSDSDRLAYLERLRRYCVQFDVAIHAWVLMSNHVHLLLTSPSPENVSSMMQWLGRWYVLHVNHKYSRTGTLWEGRYRACAVHAEDYLLECMRYIELNPVRAGLVRDPGDYPWSSYRCNAYGRPDLLVTHHALYMALASADAERRSRYRFLLCERSNRATEDAIRSATTSGHLLATESLRKEVESSTGRRLGPAPIGRPARSQDGSQPQLAEDMLPIID